MELYSGYTSIWMWDTLILGNVSSAVWRDCGKLMQGVLEMLDSSGSSNNLVLVFLFCSCEAVWGVAGSQQSMRNMWPVTWVDACHLSREPVGLAFTYTCRYGPKKILDVPFLGVPANFVITNKQWQTSSYLRIILRTFKMLHFDLSFRVQSNWWSERQVKVLYGKMVSFTVFHSSSSVIMTRIRTQPIRVHWWRHRWQIKQTVKPCTTSFWYKDAHTFYQRNWTKQ
jgi:hypothetical protein